MARKTMTAKQSAFVGHVVAGDTLAGAYRESYQADGMTPEAVRVEAARLAKNPNVSLAIEQGVQAARTRAVWSRAESMARLKIAADSLLQSLTDPPQGAALDRMATAYLALSTRLDELADVPGEVKLMAEARSDAAHCWVTHETSAFDFNTTTERRVRPWSQVRAALDAIDAGQDAPKEE